MKASRQVSGKMWRTEAGRKASAARRLTLARRLWNWQPHPAQARFFACPAQMRIAACGRRWGKTEPLSLWRVLKLGGLGNLMKSRQEVTLRFKQRYDTIYPTFFCHW